MIAVADPVSKAIANGVSTLARGLTNNANILLDPEEIRGIFVMGFSNENHNLSKLDFPDFESELYSKLRNPGIKQLIFSFKDCYFENPVNGEVPRLAGILGRVARAMEQSGKRISFCHLPQPFYDFIRTNNHPMVTRLDLHAPLEDAITKALNRAIKKAS